MTTAKLTEVDRSETTVQQLVAENRALRQALSRVQGVPAGEVRTKGPMPCFRGSANGPLMGCLRNPLRCRRPCPSHVLSYPFKSRLWCPGALRSGGWGKWFGQGALSEWYRACSRPAAQEPRFDDRSPSAKGGFVTRHRKGDSVAAALRKSLLGATAADRTSVTWYVARRLATPEHCMALPFPYACDRFM